MLRVCASAMQKTAGFLCIVSGLVWCSVRISFMHFVLYHSKRLVAQHSIVYQLFLCAVANLPNFAS